MTEWLSTLADALEQRLRNDLQWQQFYPGHCCRVASRLQSEHTASRTSLGTSGFRACLGEEHMSLPGLMINLPSLISKQWPHSCRVMCLSLLGSHSSKKRVMQCSMGTRDARKGASSEWVRTLRRDKWQPVNWVIDVWKVDSSNHQGHFSFTRLPRMANT